MPWLAIPVTVAMPRTEPFAQRFWATEGALDPGADGECGPAECEEESEQGDRRTRCDERRRGARSSGLLPATLTVAR